jgi:hypothetical protein
VTKRFAALFAVVVVSLAFRIALVETFHSSSPDGKQYWRLSQQLIRNQRYAFGPLSPPTWARPPGYPLFLAAFAARGRTLGHDEQTLAAARCNVALDLLSALLLFGILRVLGFRREVALGGFCAVIFAPLLFLFSTYALSESLSTFLGMLELYCAVRAMRGRLLPWAIATGVAAGLGQLVRADAFLMAPAAALAIWSATRSVRARAAALAACTLAALVVFAPWPIRNLRETGGLHPLGAEFSSVDGRPYAHGLIRWMRTWADGSPYDGDFTARLYFMVPIDSAHVTDKEVDDVPERAQLLELLGKHDFESDEADRAFSALAEQRTRRHPLRTFVELPLRRLGRLYLPATSGDYPFLVSWLGQPRGRAAFAVFDGLVYALALAGAVLLWRDRERRRIGAILLTAIVARSLVHTFAVPMFVSQRYLVEVYPLLLALAAVAVERIVARLPSRRHNA